MRLYRFTCGAAIVLAAVCSARAEAPSSRPYPGIECRQETRQNPPQRLFVAEVDLTDPKVHVRVSPGGPDPDGPGKWETTLMTPSSVATREGFNLAVNGDFFAARDTQDAEGEQSQYRPELWAAAIGPAVTDGKTWSVTKKKMPCLVVHKGRQVTIDMVDRPPADAWEVVAGNVMLVDGGKAVPQTNPARHPRTVVGLNEKRTKLLILVVDGRKPGIAAGMSYEELAGEMLRLGCHQALNLDGGGSSAMVLRDSGTGEYRAVNRPSDGRERAVANVLGITIGDGKKPRATTTRPSSKVN